MRLDPANWSAQLELAGLYEKHLEPEKAARHYEAAWRIQPPRREKILPRLARVRQTAGDIEGARGAWLLASRSKETRIAESARAELPDRHPYASEFRRALELDPGNARLRRELAYLLLEVKQPKAALGEFAIIVEQDPDDLLSAAQLAFLYLQRGNAAKAVELLKEAPLSGDGDIARKAGGDAARTERGSCPAPPPPGREELAIELFGRRAPALSARLRSQPSRPFRRFEAWGGA